MISHTGGSIASLIVRGLIMMGCFALACAIGAIAVIWWGC